MSFQHEKAKKFRNEVLSVSLLTNADLTAKNPPYLEALSIA